MQYPLTQTEWYPFHGNTSDDTNMLCDGNNEVKNLVSRP